MIPPHLQCLRVAEKSKSAKDCERDLTNKAQVTQSIPSGQTFHPTAHVADRMAWRCILCVRASRDLQERFSLPDDAGFPLSGALPPLHAPCAVRFALTAVCNRHHPQTCQCARTGNDARIRQAVEVMTALRLIGLMSGRRRAAAVLPWRCIQTNRCLIPPPPPPPPTTTIIREETARRLAPLLFNEDGSPNKM